ncbi:MAG TPA: hypothetical protein VG737_07365 [Cyclobacteriaceae bacterium]|nr:hypothetical protein [Cyclobacteriaceae bacterium]
MKLNSIYHPILCIIFLAAACDAGDRMPPVVNTAVDAKALLAGKHWHVADVGLKLFSMSESAEDALRSIEWFSAAKSLGEYETEAREKFTTASIELSRDSVASTVNLGLSGNQTFEITDQEKEDTPAGVRLELTGGSDDFKDMGITEATYTYFVLAANEKHLVLQAPNEVNNRKVILLLKVKE